MKELLNVVYLISSWLGLLLSYWLILASKKDSLLISTWKHVSTFTILTNILVAIAGSAILFVPNSSIGIFFSKPNVFSAITFYIKAVGIGNYFLYGFKAPDFWNTVSGVFVHGITPILALLCWLLFADKEGLSYLAVLFWLIYPLSYAFYTLGHGVWTKFYPYEFTNVDKLGWLKISVYLAGLTCCMLLGGLLFVAIGNFIVYISS